MGKIKRFIRVILIGTRKFDYLSNKQKLRILFKNYYLAMACLFLSIALSVALMTSFLFQAYPINQHTKVYYDNTLSPYEKSQAEYLVSELKPQYLTLIKSITFTNNLSDYYHPFYESKKQSDKDAETLLGFNQLDNVYVEYSSDEYDLRAVLCHEILHSYSYMSDQSHEVIYDLETYLPCYSDVKNVLETQNGY